MRHTHMLVGSINTNVRVHVHVSLRVKMYCQTKTCCHMNTGSIIFTGGDILGQEDALCCLLLIHTHVATQVTEH